MVTWDKVSGLESHLATDYTLRAIQRIVQGVVTHHSLPGRQYLEWIQVLDMLLPDTSLCLEGSTEQSDGNLGRSLRKIAMVARGKVSGQSKQGECNSLQRQGP